MSLGFFLSTRQRAELLRISHLSGAPEKPRGPQLPSPSCYSFLQPDHSVLCQEIPPTASRIVSGEANYEAGRGAAVSHGFIKA